MDQEQWLAERFEADRTRLRKVAYRLIGSTTEAEDAVQEAWLRLSRSNHSGIENLSGRLTTVVARVCLDMLRARKSHEEAMETFSDRQADAETPDLEQEQQIADSVGLALLLVLEKLTPSERVAFVLHDIFDIPFEEIASIVGRTAVTARQLASRARRRIRSEPAVTATELTTRRQIVVAFLDAVRAGDMIAIVSLLDPDVVLRADAFASPSGGPAEARGSSVVGEGALAFAERTRFAVPILLNGVPGIVAAPGGRPRYALIMDISEEKIRAIEVIADATRLNQIDFAPLDYSTPSEVR